MEIQPILNKIGEYASSVTKSILDYLTEKGFVNSPTTAKLLTILLILSISWTVLHFVQSLKTPVKILIWIVAGLLVVSIASTFIG